MSVVWRFGSKSNGESLKKDQEPAPFFAPSIFFGLILGVVPLIVRLRVFDIEGPAKGYWIYGDVHYDFFSYYKAVLFGVLTVLALVSFLLQVALSAHRLQSRNMQAIYPLGGYLLLALLSTVFSQYPREAFFGFPDRYEGFLLLLGYVVICAVAIHSPPTERNLKIYLGSLFFGGVIIGLMGILQHFGWDFLQTPGGKNLMLPAEHKGLAEGLSFPMRSIYATLYNPNYVGSYAVMLLSICASLFLTTKDRVLLFGSSFLGLIMLVTLFGSNSRAGMVGLGASAFLVLLLFRRKILQFPVRISIAGLVLMGVLFGLNIQAEGAIFERIGSIFLGSKQHGSSIPRSYIDGILLEEGALFLSIDHNAVLMLLDGEKIVLHQVDPPYPKTKMELVGMVKRGEQLQILHSLGLGDQGATIDEDDAILYQFAMANYQDTKALQVSFKEVELLFVIEGGEFFFVDYKDERTDLPAIPSFGFVRREHLGSGRGYIWSRSLPLLKDTIFLGYGPDTYPFFFPQQDYVGKQNTYGKMRILIDKPHNIFLGKALGTGVLSVLLLLFFFGEYILKGFLRYLHSPLDGLSAQVGVGVLVGVVGYLVAGVFNDSTVTVAPIFWVLLGLGFGINLQEAPSLELPPGDNEE